MAIDRRSLERALKKKGFIEAPGDHRYYVYVTKDGRQTHVRTKVSHSPKFKVIDRTLEPQIRRQLHLNRDQLAALVKCPLTQEGYEAILIQAGEVESEAEQIEAAAKK